MWKMKLHTIMITVLTMPFSAVSVTAEPNAPPSNSSPITGTPQVETNPYKPFNLEKLTPEQADKVPYAPKFKFDSDDKLIYAPPECPWPPCPDDS